MKSSIEFITASAGSGKTYRLVETVSKAIQSNECRPQGVIATTFTTAAANELKERLAEKLHQSGRHEDAILLDGGMIGTVHSVCLDILTQFALEAGLSPDLTILDESQSEILLSRAFDLILSAAGHQEIYTLSDKLGHYDPKSKTHNWRKNITKIVENARSNDIQPDTFQAIAEASWKEMRESLPKPTERNLDKELIESIQSALKELDPAPAQNNAKVCLATLTSTLRSLEKGRTSWGEWEKLHKLKPAAAQRDSVLPVQEIAALWGEHPQLHKDLKQYIIQLFTVAQDLYQTFKNLKLEAGVADFADLEKETLDLLRNSHVVRNILTKNTDLLVVDEFQDTSPIQLALFSQLAECADRVVWVGDVKQAIYGFRNADPDLITAAVRHAEKPDTLNHSWRSVPDLVHFSNELFTQAFAKYINLPKAEVSLTPQRQAHQDASPAIIVTEINSGEYTKAKEPKLKPLSKDKRHSVSADAIKAFLNSGAQIVDKASITEDCHVGKLRPVTPKDVAVLVRKRAHATAIATELRTRGIDVSLSCAGLLQTPECRLAIACLRVLCDSSDTLAIAEIISFENEHPPENWIEDRITYLSKKQPQNTNHDQPIWGTSGKVNSPTITTLTEFRKTKTIATMGPVALFDLCINSCDLPRLIAQWGPSPERVKQRLSNISGLREFLEQYQNTSEKSSAPISMPGLFSWLEDLAEDYSSEALDKCPVDPEIDAVHIATYHGSKGLEWPVVFATDLDEEPRTRLFGLRPHTDSDELDLSDPLANRSLRLWVTPLPKSKSLVRDQLESSEIGKQAMQSATSEDLRLLYVGLTRARDTLVLLHDPAKPSAWLNIAGHPEILQQGNAKELSIGTSTHPIVKSALAFEEYNSTPPPAQYIQVPTHSGSHTHRQPLQITPSAQQPLKDSSTSDLIEFGSRLNITGSITPRNYGDVMHQILATEIQHPNHPDRVARAMRLLTHWSMDQHIDPKQVLETIDRYKNWIEKQFHPTSQQVEVPFTHITSDGQQVTGFIDHLLQTTHGSVIIDHKTFPGQKSEWEKKALTYSGQLDLYRKVVHADSPQSPSPTTWIHFVTSGAAIKVITHY